MIYRVVKKETPSAEPPPLKIIVRMIATIGGYLNRSNHPEPRPTTLWVGLQRLKDFLMAPQALKDTDDTYG